MKKKILLVFLLVLGAGVPVYYRFFYNDKPVDHAQVVARVGDAVLTLDDIRNRMPAEYSDLMTYEQNVDYVKRWVDAEILYQTALARKIDQEPAVRQRHRKMQKDLLTAEMISRLCTQTAEISDAEIEKYYRDNIHLFTRKETEVKHLHMRIKTLSEAWRIRNETTQNNFLTMAGAHSLDPVPDINTLPWVTRSEVIPEIAEAVFNARAGGTTPPLKTPFGYYIVKVIDKMGPGTVRPVESVKDEIISHVTSDTQKARLDDIISRLRKKMIVEHNLNLITGRPGPAPQGAPVAPPGESAAE
jgi:parvulin-like peptidyl-prolyl isomerase